MPAIAGGSRIGDVDVEVTAPNAQILIDAGVSPAVDATRRRTGPVAQRGRIRRQARTSAFWTASVRAIGIPEHEPGGRVEAGDRSGPWRLGEGVMSGPSALAPRGLASSRPSAVAARVAALTQYGAGLREWLHLLENETQRPVPLGKKFGHAASPRIGTVREPGAGCRRTRTRPTRGPFRVIRRLGGDGSLQHRRSRSGLSTLTRPGCNTESGVHVASVTPGPGFFGPMVRSLPVPSAFGDDELEGTLTMDTRVGDELPVRRVRPRNLANRSPARSATLAAASDTYSRGSFILQPNVCCVLNPAGEA